MTTDQPSSLFRIGDIVTSVDQGPFIDVGKKYVIRANQQAPDDAVEISAGLYSVFIITGVPPWMFEPRMVL